MLDGNSQYFQRVVLRADTLTWQGNDVPESVPASAWIVDFLNWLPRYGSDLEGRMGWEAEQWLPARKHKLSKQAASSQDMLWLLLWREVDSKWLVLCHHQIQLENCSDAASPWWIVDKKLYILKSVTKKWDYWSGGKLLIKINYQLTSRAVCRI